MNIPANRLPYSEFREKLQVRINSRPGRQKTHLAFLARRLDFLTKCLANSQDIEKAKYVKWEIAALTWALNELSQQSTLPRYDD